MDKIPSSPFQPTFPSENLQKAASKEVPLPSNATPAVIPSLKKRSITEISTDESGINPEIIQARLLSREGNKATYQKGISYEGEFKADIPNGRGNFKYKDIKKYAGDVKDGFPHGYGKVTYFDGTSYEGMFENGLPSGSGVFCVDGKNIECLFKEGVYKRGKNKIEFRRSGSVYYGPCENQKGKGILITRKGDKYSGNVVSERFHGKVTILKKNKPFFEGLMEKGMPVEGTLYEDEFVYKGQVNEFFERKGKGVLRSISDNSSIEGEFLENGDVKGAYTNLDNIRIEGLFTEGATPTGVMRVTYPNGNVYIGTLEDGYAHGQGEKLLANGDRYIGKFVGGDFVEGSINFANGSSYKGEAKGSMMHGYGTFQGANFSYEGNFNEGEFEGYGKAIFTGVGEYEGLWKENRMFVNFEPEAPDERSFEWTISGTKKTNRYIGSNQIIYPNGSIYTGSIIDGLATGYGVLVSPAGEIYTGSFYDGKFFGQGKIQFKNYSYEGEFKEGLYEGKGVEIESRKNEVRVFEGTYKEGLKQGSGTLTLSNGLKLQANYKNGIFTDCNFILEKFFGFTETVFAIGNNQVLIVYSMSGVYIIANLNETEITGGTAYFPNGDRYEGQFGLANGTPRSFNPHGMGVMNWKGQGVYKGRFRNGAPDIDPAFLPLFPADEKTFFGPEKLL